MPFAASRTMLRTRSLYALETRLTILRERPSTAAADPQALALSALGWVLADEARAERLLSLTGLTPDALREGLGADAERGAVLGAVLDFLCSHEPDLLAAAEALGAAPQELAGAAEKLAR